MLEISMFRYLYFTIVTFKVNTVLSLVDEGGLSLLYCLLPELVSEGISVLSLVDEEGLSLLYSLLPELVSEGISVLSLIDEGGLSLLYCLLSTT